MIDSNQIRSEIEWFNSLSDGLDTADRTPDGKVMLSSVLADEISAHLRQTAELMELWVKPKT